MHFFRRPTRTKGASLPRIGVAAALLFALLSGLAPFGSTSTGHVCTMECCVGLPPHEAGSCHMKMSGGKKAAEPEPVKNCEMMSAGDDVTGGVSAGVMGTQDTRDSSFDAVTIVASDASDASDHCHMNSHSDSSGIQSPNDPSQPTSLAAQSFSKPCASECATGAVSFGIRPSRNAAALAHNVRPRPPTLAGKHRYFDFDFLIASASGKQIRPRGPPRCFP